ncbi:ribonuclease H-like domain-containing protein [Tanacetum coccineum]
MWLFRHKYLADGTLCRYKAHLIANGSTQLEGIDVDETFSLVVKPGTIQTILSLDTSRHWPVHQLYVKNAFLHGDLSKTVYMHQPLGFQDSAHHDYVCLLQRSLYGLKQAPQACQLERRQRLPTIEEFHLESKGDHTLLTFYMEDDVDISALTMEQFIALIPDDIKPRIVNPKIGDDVEFEINANFMRELRRKLFAGTDDEDTYEYECTVLEILDPFHFPGVTHDAIMLRVFPITLKGRALRWKNRLPAGTITTLDLLKKEFISRN